MRKNIVILLTLSLALSAILLFPPTVSATNTPAVPEFALTFVKNVYSNPAVNSTDPYTGKITSVPAETYKVTTIYVKIKNQPFIPYSDEAGHLIDLYYRVRSKGHFSDLWYLVQPGGVDGYAKASNDNYTEFEFGANYYPPNATVDFQVEAMIGYVIDTPKPPFYKYEPVFEGQVSGWSNTQSITISPSEVSQTPFYSSGASSQPTNLNNVTYFGSGWFGFAIAVLVVAILLVVGVLFLRRRRVNAPVK